MKHILKLLLPTVVCFVLPAFYTPALQAQETQQVTPAKKDVQLSPEQWKACEGVYRFSQNKEMHVQFSAKGNTLMAKLLWNNNELRFLPGSDSSFTSTEPVEGGLLTIRFLEKKNGAFTQVSLGDNRVWNRVDDYKPVVKKEMDHTPEQLKIFEGLYQFQRDKGRYLQLAEKENKLVMRQYWDGREVKFVPDSALHFFSREIPQFTITFVKDGNGDISQLLAFDRDRWNKMKNPQFTPLQLKAFEGKYQFKDDKDDIIRITAKGNTLVVKQLWDGKEIVLEPRSDSFFYCDDQSYSLNFTRDKDGSVIQVLVLSTDLFEKVKE